MNVVQNYYLVDAKGRTLGRLASKIATILMGKNSVTYRSNFAPQNYVVVINSAQVVLTGNKTKQKIYFSNRRKYIGNLKKVTYENMMEKKPTEVLIHAVKGMLPKNKLKVAMLKHLKVYSTSTHPHQAQKVQKIEL